MVGRPSGGVRLQPSGGNDQTCTQHRCPPAEAAHPSGRTPRQRDFVALWQVSSPGLHSARRSLCQAARPLGGVRLQPFGGNGPISTPPLYPPPEAAHPSERATRNGFGPCAGLQRFGGNAREGRHAAAGLTCTSPLFLRDAVHFPRILATARTRARKQAKCTDACKEMAEVHAETSVWRAF